MALSFPTSPTAGDQYVGDGVTYQYDGTLSAWIKLSPVQSALAGAAAQTGAAIIPGGDDAERAAIATPAAGMFRYNDQTAPAVMEYYDGAAWKTLSTGGGGAVGQIWELAAMPAPVSTIDSFAYHPTNGEFGAICVEYSGSRRLYTSPDGVTWTRGSFNLPANVSGLRPGKGSAWITNVISGGGATNVVFIPSLTTAPVPGVAPTGLQLSITRYVPSTDQYIQWGSTAGGGGVAVSIAVYKSPDGNTWSPALTNSPTNLTYLTAGITDWGINGNFIEGSVAQAGGGGAGGTLLCRPVSTDGGNTWSLSGVTLASAGGGPYFGSEQWSYANGFWTRYVGLGHLTSGFYSQSTGAPGAFTDGGINPYTITSVPGAVGPFGSSGGPGYRYYPDLNLFPTSSSVVVVPASVLPDFNIGASVHSPAANRTISMNNSGTNPYYFMSPPA